MRIVDRLSIVRGSSAVALLVTAALVVSGCESSPEAQNADGATRPPTASSPAPRLPAESTPANAAGAAGSSSATTAPARAGSGAPVHASLLQADGGVYGVGMPIIVRFDKRVTDKTAFERAAAVTVNAKPVSGAWYWQRSSADGKAVEAHFRQQAYWAANSRVQVNLPIKNLSAGKGLRYDNDLTLDMTTGPRQITRVDCATKKVTVTRDDKVVRTMPTSCGKAKTPTYNGVKVVMQKGEAKPGSSQLRPNGAVRMTSNDPGNTYDLIVPWSVRLTMSGEYTHAASWNGGNIGRRSTSNGCTNLNEADAKWLYDFSRLGDVMVYTNTGGGRTPSWDGYGDWNVDWATYSDGGLL